MIPPISEFLSTDCGSCGARISLFARCCPACQARNAWYNAVIGGAAAVVLLLVGSLVALAWHALRAKEAPQVATQSPPAGTASAPADSASDYGWLVQAMADCEEEGKRLPDTLSFLIVPLSKTDTVLPGWAPVPIGTAGNSVVLLASTDALIGLRNGAFALYAKPLAFTVSDQASSTVYKWKPAVGVSALKTRVAGLENLKLGFEIPDVAEGIEWGPTLKMERGTCYWINPLIRTAARSG
jgi:hypothetical protein